MPLLYAVKHVFRSWTLFLALLIGVTLASTFFAGTDIKANATATQALEQQLSHVYVDLTAYSNVMNATQILEAKERISAIQGITHVEAISTAEGQVTYVENNSVNEYYVTTVGIANDSLVYDGWLNRPAELGENETYITEESALATKTKIGDAIQVSYSAYRQYQLPPDIVTFNLTVKGFARLDDKAYAIAHGYFLRQVFVNVEQVPSFDTGLLIVSWEKTIRKLLSAANELNPSSGLVSTNFLIYFDHNALISAWDIDTSIKNIKDLQILVQNELVLSGMGSSVTNNLESILNTFRFMSIALRFAFTIVSLPIFFMAWYVGTTVSDVSFNLRRREIGLLLTKGFSRGQIQRLFLTETIVIGSIGGVLGVLFGFLLNPIFTGFSTDAFFNPNLISPYTMAFTIAFGVIMAIVSTYSSAKKSSQLPTVDALREYLPMEETKAYRKRLTWIAFILGTYKIIVFMLGLNMTEILSRLAFGGANFIFIVFIGLFLILDAILNYIGPLLFFWGITKLLIVGSVKFQELTTRAAKFLGELGTLATKNVRRNPARSAAIAFLLALIVSYSVQVSGQLASEHDFAVRTIYNYVGADVSFYIPFVNEAKNISSTVFANLSSSIESSTIEYTFEAQGTVHNLNLKAVQPESWLKTVYYESSWFTGNDMTKAFENLATDNKTIILRLAEARLLKLNVGDQIILYLGGSNATALKIVGFFGPEPTQQEQGSSFAGYWSFVSEELYNEASGNVNPSTRMLIKLKSGADEESAAKSIRDLKLNVSSVQSFAEKWKETQSNVFNVGMLDIQRLGIFFAILAASVGTALVSAVSMKERGREATIMSVRGLSFKQLVIMFLTENLALVLFSTMLGISVGFVILYGNISSNNSFLGESLIMRRLVFPLDSVLTLASCLILIFASTILPIVIMSRRYVTKLERMVRLR
jgi:ABC-type lipoprotein release transport system permease subunit